MVTNTRLNYSHFLYEQGLVPRFVVVFFSANTLYLTSTQSKLHIVEIDHQASDPVFTKKQIDVFFPPEATNDFPVAMQVSKRHGIVYLVTKYGFIHLYDLESGACLYINRISGETIFVTAEHEASHGLIGVNKKGQVLSVDVDEQTIIPYLLLNPNNTELAFKLASRANLPGADDLYVKQYQQLFQSGQFDQAAQIAANSPRVSQIDIDVQRADRS
jgi:clathrin heavy chain